MFIAGSGAASVTLAFLFSQAIVDISPLQEPPPIDQMMYYLEFFGFATIGYFASTTLVWNNRRLRNFVVPLIPICVIGSIFCSALMSIYIYIANKLIYEPNSLLKPVTFTFTLWAIVIWSVVFFFVSCPVSALTSAIYTNWANKNKGLFLFANREQVEKTAPKA